MKQDNNKNLSVTYNLLNLPRTYYINNDNNSIGYLGDGTKIWSYTRMGTAKSTNEYIGPFVYRDGDPDYLITGEVRVVFMDGGLSYYEYHIKDHLGNVRVAFKNNNSSPEVLQTSDYYPFGLRMGESYDNSSFYSRNRYLYNGKELVPDVNLNCYDYGHRYYDAQTGRFTTQDRYSEKY
jgi:RHS repeat-associated protein